mgnify:FL=1
MMKKIIFLLLILFLLPFSAVQAYSFILKDDGTPDTSSQPATSFYELQYNAGDLYSNLGNNYQNYTLSFTDKINSISLATSTYDDSDQINRVTTKAPEPETLFLFGTGLVGLAWLGRKRLKRRK